jgi:hypothetical protein
MNGGLQFGKNQIHFLSVVRGGDLCAQFPDAVIDAARVNGHNKDFRGPRRWRLSLPRFPDCSIPYILYEPACWICRFPAPMDGFVKVLRTALSEPVGNTTPSGVLFGL